MSGLEYLRPSQWTAVKLAGLLCRWPCWALQVRDVLGKRQKGNEVPGGPLDPTPFTCVQVWLSLSRCGTTATARTLSTTRLPLMGPIQ